MVIEVDYVGMELRMMAYAMRDRRRFCQFLLESFGVRCPKDGDCQVGKLTVIRGCSEERCPLNHSEVVCGTKDAGR